MRFDLTLLFQLLLLCFTLGIPAIPAQAQDANAANEWRQLGANSAHSRSLSGTLTPPLSTDWRIKLPGLPLTAAVASGTTLYIAGERADDPANALSISAFNTQNGHLKWACRDVMGGNGFGLFATVRGIFVGRHNRLEYLAADNGTNLLKSNIGVSWLSGLVGNRLYFGPSPESDHVSFQTLDVNTLQLGPVTGLLIPGSQSYGFFPGDQGYGQGYFGPGYVGILDFDARSDQKIPLFMQDDTNVITTEGAPAYKPRDLVFTGLDRGLAVGGGGRVFITFSSKGTRALAAIPPSGKFIWQHDFPNKDVGGYGSQDLYNRVTTTPTEVFITVSPLLYAFDAATGRILWTAKYQYPLVQDSNPGPLVMGNFLYALSSSTPVPKSAVPLTSSSSKTGWADTLQAYSVETGHLLWSHRMGHRLISIIGHRGALYVIDSVPHAHDFRSDYFLIKLTDRSRGSK